MLTKLLKKDFQATSRYFIPLIIGFIVISTFCKIFFEVGIVSSTDNDFILIVTTIFLSLYVIYIIGFYILTYVIIVGDFYKTMVSEQAYLTHTLPVKTSTLLYSKIIVSVVWQTFVELLIIFSFFLFVIGHMSDINLTELLMQFEMVMGISFKLYITFIAICLFLGSIFNPLLFFTSIALGHLFGKHRVLGAILSYIGIYSVLQVISVIMLIAFGYSISTTIGMGESPETFGNLFTSLMWPSIGFTLIFGIAFYILTHYIFRKKLNLE